MFNRSNRTYAVSVENQAPQLLPKNISVRRRLELDFLRIPRTSFGPVWPRGSSKSSSAGGSRLWTDEGSFSCFLFKCLVLESFVGVVDCLSLLKDFFMLSTRRNEEVSTMFSTLDIDSFTNFLKSNGFDVPKVSLMVPPNSNNVSSISLRRLVKLSELERLDKILVGVDPPVPVTELFDDCLDSNFCDSENGLLLQCAPSSRNEVNV